jgi:AcrR family transcriptional regulator
MRTCDPKRGLLILDTAAKLFAKHHYHEVRMDDIAADAGVAKGTLYRYYRDKDELYVALTMHGIQKIYEQSRDQIAGPGEPEQKLRDFITGVVRYYEQYPYFLELIQRIETSGSSESVAALQETRKQWYLLVIELITQLKSGGRPMASDPELAALALQGIIRGILRFKSQPWPADLPDSIYRQFMHGLAPVPRHVNGKP